MIFCIGFTTISNAQDSLKATINNYLEEQHAASKQNEKAINCIIDFNIRNTIRSI